MKLLFALLMPLMAYAGIPRPTDHTVQESARLQLFDNEFAVRHNQVQGISRVLKFGYNLDVDTGAEEAIVSYEGDIDLPSSADTVTIVSTDANDAAGDTGARLISVECLDENYDTVTFTMVPNGTSNVTSTQTCIAINSMRVATAGSSRSNEGTITATQTNTGDTLRQIPAGDSVTQSCHYTVPNGKKAYFDNVILEVIKLTGGATPAVVFRSKLYRPSTGVIYKNIRAYIDATKTNHLSLEKATVTPAQEGDVIWITASTDTDNTQVSCRTNIVLIDTE